MLAQLLADGCPSPLSDLYVSVDRTYLVRSIDESGYFSVSDLKQSGPSDGRIPNNAKLASNFACLVEFPAILAKGVAVALVS